MVSYQVRDVYRPSRDTLDVIFDVTLNGEWIPASVVEHHFDKLSYVEMGSQMGFIVSILLSLSRFFPLRYGFSMIIKSRGN